MRPKNQRECEYMNVSCVYVSALREGFLAIKNNLRDWDENGMNSSSVWRKKSITFY